MPASYQTYFDLNLKFVKISGKTHLFELRDLAVEYLSDPKTDLRNRFLVDLTDLTNARAKFIDVFTLASLYKRELSHLEEPIEVAIVAPSKLSYGISRMFSAFMSSEKVMKVKIFDDMYAAGSWLNLSLSELDLVRASWAFELPRGAN